MSRKCGTGACASRACVALRRAGLACPHSRGRLCHTQAPTGAPTIEPRILPSRPEVRTHEGCGYIFPPMHRQECSRRLQPARRLRGKGILQDSIKSNAPTVTFSSTVLRSCNKTHCRLGGTVGRGFPWPRPGSARRPAPKPVRRGARLSPMGRRLPLGMALPPSIPLGCRWHPNGMPEARGARATGLTGLERLTKTCP